MFDAVLPDCSYSVLSLFVNALRLVDAIDILPAAILAATGLYATPRAPVLVDGFTTTWTRRLDLFLPHRLAHYGFTSSSRSECSDSSECLLVTTNDASFR